MTRKKKHNRSLIFLARLGFGFFYLAMDASDGGMKVITVKDRHTHTRAFPCAVHAMVGATYMHASFHLPFFSTFLNPFESEGVESGWIDVSQQTCVRRQFRGDPDTTNTRAHISSVCHPVRIYFHRLVVQSDYRWADYRLLSPHTHTHIIHT